MEFDILGSKVRIKPNEGDERLAVKAVEMVQAEVGKMLDANSSLSNIDAAVLVALKMASEKLDIEAEYKENVLALRSGVQDALNFIEEVSPGTIQLK